MADHQKEGSISDNPLLSESADSWERLIEAINPASLLYIIDSRMGHLLRSRLTAEDIYQQVLLEAWSRRKDIRWRGIRAFRSWVLTAVNSRLRDAIDHETAEKRGGAAAALTGSPLSFHADDSTGPAFPWPISSTTPGRLAIYREIAEAMGRALDTVPSESREIVHLRLFEQLDFEEIATKTGVSSAAVSHRFRKGLSLYRRSLRRERLVSTSDGFRSLNATGPEAPLSEIEDHDSES